MVVNQPLGNSNINHQYAIIDEASKLFDLGYSVYIEHIILLKEYGKVVVDIYAIKNNKEIIIEVGTLSRPRYLRDKWREGKISLYTDNSARLPLIKEAMPNAKIVWVHQWKNWISPATISEYNNQINYHKYEQSVECKENLLKIAKDMAARMRSAKAF